MCDEKTRASKVKGKWIVFSVTISGDTVNVVLLGVKNVL